MANVLYLRCPNCSNEFRARDQIPEESFEGVTVPGSEERCPTCEQMVPVEAPNAFYQEG
jgi:endogenous inhibitor of DNA gyrase (YacG/DUF329 family)